MDPVVHFEMPYEDRGRMADFYAKAFGWKAEMLGPEMGEYVVMNTCEKDEQTKFPKKPGMINGGFYKKPEDKLGQCPSVVIAVEDINASLKKLEEAGGKPLGQPMDIPGIGKYASFLDTEGNRVSVIQPNPMN
ncbi:MAG: hypothetical protein ACD_28C00181G0002 [uncultured bacterium]|nr:MAG: hypothetical protein ACD_28C00181G0002 [uncultured bacterium]KKT75630.1 MAG: Glyoxalase/bleomycin resistance protein/dioxygenase [Candidatus Peregrinibacteria bacterium GW2011_GWA2_44_7]